MKKLNVDNRVYSKLEDFKYKYEKKFKTKISFSSIIEGLLDE